MKKITLISIVAIIVVLITWRLVAVKGKMDEAKETSTHTTDLAIPVNVYKAKDEALSSSLSKTGKLIPYKEADITALTAGKVVNVNFALGNMVSAGATVAKVDSRTLELNLNQAKLSKNKAEVDYNRFKRLLEGEATTESTFQDIKLNYENTQNQIALLEKQIADTRIKAPISGQVVSKNIEPGEFVSTGMTIGKIVDLSRLKVRVMVGETSVYDLKMNQAVTVTTDIYQDVVYHGKITFISGQGDAAFNYEVEITLENNKKANPLKAGTYAYVDFNQSADIKGITIPRTALVESLQNPFVYVVKNNVLEKRNITIEKDLGSKLLIKNGLQAGEEVVTSGLVNVREGSKVNPIREEVKQTVKKEAAAANKK